MRRLWHRMVLAGLVCVTGTSFRVDGGGIPWSDEDQNLPRTIEQTDIDAAMHKLRERQRQRAENPPATQPSARPTPDFDDWHAPYTREVVTARKLELLRHYDQHIFRARQALRRQMIEPSTVRELVAEQAALQLLALDKFRALVMDADARNAERIGRYREAFGELQAAGSTVVTILMKAGLIDSAQPLPDDPLSEEIETARGVRRVYYNFILPNREGMLRRHNGYVEFQFAEQQGMWLPTWADVEGGPIPLFDAEAFVPLRPYRLVYDGATFIVAQEAPPRPAPQFSLIAPRAIQEIGRPDVVASQRR